MNYIKELAQFEDYLSGRVAPGTVREYTYALKKWLESLDGLEPSKELAQSHIDLLAKKKGASTVNLRAHAIVRWFRWKNEHIQLDCPTVRIPPPEYLNMKQFGKLLNACTSILEKALITVLFDTAVRISELLNLEEDDIDWTNKFIAVIRKGGRKENVNISEKALEVLAEWLDTRPYGSRKVFGNLDYYDAQDMIKKAGRRAKLKLHPHMLRHSRAIQLLKSGAPPYVVQQHLGHKSIATTMNIYGMFTATDLKEELAPW